MPPSPYTKTLAEAVGMTAEALLAELPLWTCRRCRTNWHDPWLTTEASQWLYGVGRPMHRFGWISLQHWVEKRPASFLAARSSLWNLLRTKAAGPMRYAEFNCPFAGLAFAEADRYGDQGRQFLRIRQRQLAGSATARRAVVDDQGSFLSDRTLLVARSAMCWGENCRSQGVSCRDLANGLLFRRTVTLDEAERTGERFDLVGSFMLDHMPDPNGTLYRLMKLARRVLLEMHPPGWTDVQHLYNINPSLIDVVRRNGVHVRDLTAHTRVDDVTGPLVFLLSREDSLAWLD